MNRKDRRAAKSAGANVHGSPIVEALYKDALAAHQAGNTDSAYQLYRQILEMEPEHTDSLHMLGIIASQVGKHETAVELIGRAIKLRDNVPYYHNHMCNALFALEKYDEAKKKLRTRRPAQERLSRSLQ